LLLIFSFYSIAFKSLHLSIRLIETRGNHFRFDSVFIKKKPNKKKLKKIKPNRNLFRFSFLGQKPVQIGLAWFFQFGSVFSVWIGFFRFGFDSVRFFRSQAYKIKTEPVGFFKILICFFHGSVFLIFFSGFLGLIDFLIFFAHL